MPTVLRIGSLRVVIYPNDHRPPHVHVIGEGCEAVFNLDCPEGPVEIRENHGFSLKRAQAIVRALEENLEQLCEAWRTIHG
jgi:Fe2+ or Zn2+ uptake regulation protein